MGARPYRLPHLPRRGVALRAERGGVQCGGVDTRGGAGGTGEEEEGGGSARLGWTRGS